MLGFCFLWSDGVAKRVPGQPSIEHYIKTLACEMWETSIRCDEIRTSMRRTRATEWTDQQHKSARKGTSKSFKSLGNASSFTFQQKGVRQKALLLDFAVISRLQTYHPAWSLRIGHSELSRTSRVFTMLVTNQQEVAKPATREVLPSWKCGGFAFKTSLRLTVATVCKVPLFIRLLSCIVGLVKTAPV